MTLFWSDNHIYQTIVWPNPSISGVNAGLILGGGGGGGGGDREERWGREGLSLRVIATTGSASTHYG